MPSCSPFSPLYCTYKLAFDPQLHVNFLDFHFYLFSLTCISLTTFSVFLFLSLSSSLGITSRIRWHRWTPHWPKHCTTPASAVFIIVDCRGRRPALDWHEKEKALCSEEYFKSQFGPNPQWRKKKRKKRKSKTKTTHTKKTTTAGCVSLSPIPSVTKCPGSVSWSEEV